MSCSTRSTERLPRARGFTLLEVIIAVTIFSVVIAVALQQVSESTDSTRTVTANADLRRVGEGAMNDIVRELRSTLAPFASVPTTNDAIEFWRVTQLDLDASGQGVGRPPLNGPTAFAWVINTSSPVDGMPAPYPRIETSPSLQAKPTFAQTLIHRYKQSGTELIHEWGTAAQLNAGTATSVALLKELVPVTSPAQQQPAPGGAISVTHGFKVEPVAPTTTVPGLMTANENNRFLDKPTTLRVTLKLRRLIGINKSSFNKEYAWVTIQNDIELRPTRKY